MKPFSETSFYTVHILSFSQIVAHYLRQNLISYVDFLIKIDNDFKFAWLGKYKMIQIVDTGNVSGPDGKYEICMQKSIAYKTVTEC